MQDFYLAYQIVENEAYGGDYEEYSNVLSVFPTLENAYKAIMELDEVNEDKETDNYEILFYNALSELEPGEKMFDECGNAYNSYHVLKYHSGAGIGCFSYIKDYKILKYCI